MAVANGTTNGHANSNDTPPTANNSSSSETTGTHPGSNLPPLPIVIAGGGCVGLFLALLLSHSDPPIPNPILVIEPTTLDPTSTRAMAHQPPTYPLLSQIPGLLPELMEKGSLSEGLCFRKSVKEGSGVIAEKVFDNRGEGVKGKGQLLLPQGRFQEVLLRRLEGRGGVEVRIGSMVTGVQEGEGSVCVTISPASSSASPSSSPSNSNDDEEEEEQLEAAYLIGADGAHSTVRRLLAIDFPGETLDAYLVATDLHFDFHAHGFHDANFIIDPDHHGLIGRITTAPPSSPQNPSKPPLWRVSYAVPATLSPHQITESVHTYLATMLPNQGKHPNGSPAYQLTRIAPYKPHQRLVASLNPTPHSLLIGDAAHLTNPYAGLGLASGIADASSLAQVLARTLAGRAADAALLLREWSRARRAVFAQVVDGPSRAAFARVRRDVRSGEMVESLVAGDAVVGGLVGGRPVKGGELGTRGEELGGW